MLSKHALEVLDELDDAADPVKFALHETLADHADSDAALLNLARQFANLADDVFSRLIAASRDAQNNPAADRDG